jgi:hypothetical protein
MKRGSDHLAVEDGPFLSGTSNKWMTRIEFALDYTDEEGSSVSLLDDIWLSCCPRNIKFCNDYQDSKRYGKSVLELARLIPNITCLGITVIFPWDTDLQTHPRSKLSRLFWRDAILADTPKFQHRFEVLDPWKKDSKNSNVPGTAPYSVSNNSRCTYT